jgi:hypothetical protein
VITDIAERRFSWLAQQRGCRLWHETDLEQVMTVRSKRPDFFVRSPASDFLAEVKSFETVGPLARPDRVFTVAIEKLLKPFRGAIHEAADQLRPYRELSLPRVVVLDDWRNVGVSTETEILIQLFGELKFVIPVSPVQISEPLPAAHFAYGGGRSLGDDSRTYISAVLLTETIGADDHTDRMTERPMRARVLHNPFATDPLPLAAFGGANDKHLVHDNGVWQIGSAAEMAERLNPGLAAHSAGS